MPEFAIDDTSVKVLIDDTGAKIFVAAPGGFPPEPPYIRYTPWEPMPGALAGKVAELTAAVADLQQRLARLEGMTLRRDGEL